MRLTGEMITTLADFADGAECLVTQNKASTGIMDGERHRRIHVKRVEDNETVWVYDTGQIERVAKEG